MVVVVIVMVVAVVAEREAMLLICGSGGDSRCGILMAVVSVVVEVVVVRSLGDNSRGLVVLKKILLVEVKIQRDVSAGG